MGGRDRDREIAELAFNLPTTQQGTGGGHINKKIIENGNNWREKKIKGIF